MAASKMILTGKVALMTGGTGPWNGPPEMRVVEEGQ